MLCLSFKLTKYSRTTTWAPRQVVNIRWFSDDEKLDEKEKPKKEKPKERKIKNQEALDRLKTLLSNMPTGTSKTEVKVITATKKKVDSKLKVVERKEKDPK